MAFNFVDGNTVTGEGNTTPLDSVNRAVQGDFVINGGSVTQRGAGTNMSVDVTAASYMIGGTFYSVTGTTNVVISAAPAAGLERFDVIYADSSSTISVTAGAAATTGTAKIPDITVTTKIPLAVVYVLTGTSAITNAMITDIRVVNKTRPLRLYQTSGSFTNTTIGDTATFTVPAGLCTSTAEKFRVTANIYASVGLVASKLRVDGVDAGIVPNTVAQTVGGITSTITQDQGTNTVAWLNSVGTAAGPDRITGLSANFMTAGFTIKLRTGVNAAGTGYYSYSVYLE